MGDTDTADVTSIVPSATETYKWGGMVLGSDGLLYGVPYYETTLLIIDPTTNTADTTSVTGLPAGSHKTLSSVFANGCVISIPLNSGHVLGIDINTYRVQAVYETFLAGTTKYSGGVLANNGLVYGIPNSADHMLVIDAHTAA